MAGNLYVVLAAAAWAAAGQTPSAPCNCNQPAATAPAYSQDKPRLGLFNRLRYGTPQPYGMLTYPVVPTNASARTGAAQRGEPPVAQGMPVSVPAVQDPAARLKIDEKYEDKVGHDENYTWVTGHLFYVHAEGGRWVVRYAVEGEVDKYGGSIVLAPGVEMRNYREGDLVCVAGEVVKEGRTSRGLGGALYRVNAINMVERSDP